MDAVHRQQGARQRAAAAAPVQAGRQVCPLCLSHLKQPRLQLGAVGPASVQITSCTRKVSAVFCKATAGIKFSVLHCPRCFRPGMSCC